MQGTGITSSGGSRREWDRGGARGVGGGVGEGVPTPLLCARRAPQPTPYVRVLRRGREQPRRLPRHLCPGRIREPDLPLPARPVGGREDPPPPRRLVRPRGSSGGGRLPVGRRLR